jgi:tetratricopeptide (TPR) repeat protein
MIVITIDTLRADRVTPQVAPALARLAGESVAFDTAITVAPLTLPAHASLLTAAYPPIHGVRDNAVFSLPAGTPTYASALRDRGYATAAFVSAIVLDSRFGLGAGFDTYDDEIGDAPERHAPDTLARAREWITTKAAGKPFFVWVHLFEPHAPYLTGSYESEVTAVDRALDGFFGTLRERGLWDDLVLSVTADHGESLGEHGEKTHGFFVYDSTLRIPWLLKSPGLTPRRYAHQVRIVDVMPTMASLAGAGAGALDAADGVDLRPLIASGESPRVEAYADTWLPRDQFQWSDLRTIRTEQLKYIAAPRPELYDLAADPGEQHNVIADRADDAARLRRILDAIDRRGVRPGSDRGRTGVRPGSERSGTDAAVDEKLRALGYIGYAPAVPVSSSAALADPKDKLEVYTRAMDALELSEAGKAKDAVATLDAATRLDPNVAQVHYLKGSVLGTEGRYADAAAALEKAVALSPRFVLARFKLALAYVRLSRLDRAEEILRSVIADEPRNFRALHNLAAIAYSRGDLAAAEKLERQALAIDSEYFEAWNTLGAIFVVSKRTGEALDALSTAVKLNPSSGQAHYNLALAQRAGGQVRAAEENAAKACTLDRRYCK